MSESRIRSAVARQSVKGCKNFQYRLKLKVEKMPAQQKVTNQIPTPVAIVKEPLKDLIFWQAPTRPFKRKDREYYTTIGAIVFLLGIILLFLKEWLLIGVIIAFAFVSYVLSTVEPEEVEHKITTRGVFTGNKNYPFENLWRFWFSKKWGDEILHLETRLMFPRQLQLLLGEQNKEEVQKILEKYLIFEEPEKTFVDKAASWLQKKVPLEKEAPVA